MSDVFFGEIRIFPYGFTPLDWADCDGTLLPIFQYQTLFTVIGNKFGGDGQTSFALPNLLGRAPMQWGAGPGLTSRAFASSGGATSATLTEAQMPNHSHGAQLEKEASDVPVATNNYLGMMMKGTAARKMYIPKTSTTMPDTVMSPQSLTMTGGNQAHENRQPYLALRFCIALFGDYPMPPSS